MRQTPALTVWRNHYIRTPPGDGAGQERRNHRMAAEFSAGPSGDDRLLKAQLVHMIHALLKERGLKQVEAARLFGVQQPDVSKMLSGDFRQFSMERLLRFLVALGQDVEIVVKPHEAQASRAATLRIA
jgi:predicted XRE-type DNA-binding protein